MFEKYYQERQELINRQLKNMVTVVSPAYSPAINTSVLLRTIYDIPSMSDSDLRRFIQRSFKSILNNVFFGNNDSNVYVRCFMDIRFLEAFIDVLNTGQFVDRDDIVKINTICYHYITFGTNQDPMIKNRMMLMASIVNKPKLPSLFGIGLNNNLANTLLIARNSDLNLETCVKRVDFIIITQPVELMTQEMITNILRILYNIRPNDSDPRDWLSVFQYIMMDVVPEYDEYDETTHWVTDEVQEVDSTLSLSALEILDNLESRAIRSVLLYYAEDYAMVNSYRKLRFSMKRLSEDYARINRVVSELRMNEGIIVP